MRAAGFVVSLFGDNLRVVGGCVRDVEAVLGDLPARVNIVAAMLDEVLVADPSRGQAFSGRPLT